MIGAKIKRIETNTLRIEISWNNKRSFAQIEKEIIRFERREDKCLNNNESLPSRLTEGKDDTFVLRFNYTVYIFENFFGIKTLQSMVQRTLLTKSFSFLL